MGRRKPRVLITGIAGFGGRHLATLLGKDCTVVGLEHPRALKKAASGDLPAVDILPCDLVDIGPETLREVAGRAGLDAVYHLAAIASVHLSWGSLQQTVTVNAMGSLNLMEALLRLKKVPPILLVGSADEYGSVRAAKQPVRESVDLNPRSPYALSKLWQEDLGRYYGNHGDLAVYLTRTFNHTGPGQAPNFVCSDFARQIALMEAGKMEPVLSVGNLKAVRDFLDVRDVVRAYRLIVEKGKTNTPYNVASRKTYSIAEVLDMLLNLTGLKITVRRDPAKKRPADVPLQWGDPGRLKRATGWKPRYAFAETLSDLLDWWRGRVRSGEEKGA